MKRALILVCFCFPSIVFSQYVYSPNTIYMIPPTSGCNGEWAVLDTMHSSGACIAFTYLIDPVGCAVVNHRNGDTLFFDLCAIPCGVIIMDASGNSCLICDVAFATGLGTLQHEQALTRPDPNQPRKLIRILDLLGRETTFKPNTPLIYQYDDGSVEKVIREH